MITSHNQSATQKRRNPRGRWLAIGVMIAGLVAIFWLWRFEGRPFWLGFGAQSLSDGSVLAIRSLNYGEEIELYTGSHFQRWFRNWIPKGGWSWGPLEVQAPGLVKITAAGEAFLFIELEVIRPSNGPSKLDTPSINGTFRGVLVGESGVGYPQRFVEPGRLRSNGFGGFVCKVFPKQSEWLTLHLEHQSFRETTWNTLASFQFRNPATVVPRDWSSRLGSRVIHTNGLTFSLGDVVVQRSEDGRSDHWIPELRMPLSIERDGAPLSDWKLTGVVVKDEAGNQGRYASFDRENQGTVRTHGEPLVDPSLVWKVVASFESNPYLSTDQWFRIPLPEISSEADAEMYGDVTVGIHRSGAKRLSFQLPSDRPDLLLKYVELRSRSGRSYRHTARRVADHEFTVGIRNPEPGDELIWLEFALVRSATVPFFVRPRIVGGPIAER